MTVIDDLPPLRETIRRHGLSAKKSLGQNFLLDLNLTARIARAGGPLDGVTVVEVGPGPGGLTRALIAQGARRVIAIERDSRAIAALGEVAAHYPGRVTVIEGDALEFDWQSFPAASLMGNTNTLGTPPFPPPRGEGSGFINTMIKGGSRAGFAGFISPRLRGEIAPSLTLPRLRGREGRGRVRGPLHASELVETPPYPNPLPASGDRERKVCTPAVSGSTGPPLGIGGRGTFGAQSSNPQSSPANGDRPETHDANTDGSPPARAAEARIVANLPYNVATALLVRWLGVEPWPPWYDSLVLMFQREVAERIVAAPGTKQYGRLAVMAQWRTEARIMFDVAPSAFVPPPKVTSSVVRLVPRAAPLPCSRATLERVTAAAFGQRRKTLRQSLRTLGHDPQPILAAAGIDPMARAEDVAVAGFVALANALDANHTGRQ